MDIFKDDMQHTVDLNIMTNCNNTLIVVEASTMYKSR